MKLQNYILTLILFIIPIIYGYSTAQMPDILIYKGDTLPIFANPLETLDNIDSLRPKFFGDKTGCESTDCWRSYQAKWIIINDELYLKDISSCCYYEDDIKADLNKLFPGKCINGLVKADWYNFLIFIPKGKLIYYIHSSYESLYEQEVELSFERGKLINEIIYDNSKSKHSIYAQDQTVFNEYVYSNINWDLYTQNEDIRLYLRFSSNEQGKIDSVRVLRSANENLSEEAIRVIKSIPYWNIFYKKGEFKRMRWVYPITFSQSNKKRYSKK